MKEIIFCGVDGVPFIKDRESTAIISILDKSESAHRPQLQDFAMSLILDFEDTAEETKLMQPGGFGDYPSAQDNLRFAQGKSERVFDMNDAKRIAHFVAQASRSEHVNVLAVHCFQGVSRSAAVALWASSYLGIPINSCNGTSGANPRVLRVLNRVELD